jgi:hypothetical protein
MLLLAVSSVPLKKQGSLKLSEVELKVKKKKEAPVHLDILGQPLAEGNYVAMAHHNMLQICKITKLNQKMIRAVPVKGNYRADGGYLVYSNRAILLSGPAALAYILTYAGTR